MSTSESSFQQAIAAKPDDDQPRLIYADWLEEQGDPRCELIRVQCRLAALPPGDAACWELQQREEALLANYLSKWTKLLPKFPRIPWGIEPRYGTQRASFARGMMEHVTFPGYKQYEESFDDIWQVTPARQVRINKWGNKAIPAFFASDGYRRVDGLWLTMDSVDTQLEQARTLLAAPELSRLKKLRIFDRMLDGSCVDLLLQAPLENLQVLEIDQTDIGDELCARIGAWDRLQQVTSLQFSGNACGTGGLSALAGSAHVNNLHTLSLRRNHFGDEPLEVLAASAQLNSLVDLDLSFNNFSRPGMAALAASKLLRGVRRLNLTFCETAANSVELLTTSEHLTSLQHLSLNRMQTLNDTALRAIAASPYLGELRRLDIDRGVYTAGGLMAVVDSPNLPKLDFLSLSESLEELNVNALKKLRDRFPHMRRRSKRSNSPNYATDPRYFE